MPIYIYKAKSYSGETKTGRMEARDAHDLARMLREEGFVLISTEASKEAGAKTPRFAGGLGALMGRFFGVPLVEKMMFSRHLSVMIGAGMSLTRSLAALQEETQNQLFKQTLAAIQESVEKGTSFADSLSVHPTIFNDLYVNMVRVGEESGKLEEVLKVLARQLQKDHELHSRIRGAMIYPAVILTAMLGIGTLMLIMVVPKLAEVFEELNVPLPITTKFVIAVGLFVATYKFFLPLAVILGFFLVSRILKTRFGKYAMDWLLLHAPLLKGITLKVNAARFSRTFSSLVESGVPIIRALSIVAGTLTNHYFQNSILGSVEAVKRGEQLASHLKTSSRLWPPIVVQMVAVGEETGSLGEVMRRLAIFYEAEVSNITRNLSSIIEPVLMLLIGGAVGFFAVSMIQPMYSMMNNI